MTTGKKNVALSEVCLSYGRGKNPSYVEDSNCRVINQACIYWEGLKLENVKFQNPDKFKDENKLHTGVVLLNSTGTGTIGRASVFYSPNDGKSYMADSHVTLLVPDTSIILPEILRCYFYCENTQQELYRTCVNGTTSQAELSKPALGRMQVPIIDIDEQKAFVEFYLQSDKSK